MLVAGMCRVRRTRLNAEVHPVLSLLSVNKSVEVCDSLLRIWIPSPHL